jgi:voltage-dependent calcium channel T type alpha-1G
VQFQIILCCQKWIKGTWLETRQNHSLLIFAPDNWLRLRCANLASKKWFDFVILFIIGLNCITLAMERPTIPHDSFERYFLNVADYIFTVIFTIEMGIKVIAKGCVCGENAYFKDGWNVMDGTLVIISLVNILVDLVAQASPKIFGVIRVLRLLRALRPLRVINRAPGVKLVVQTLISSLKPIGNIVLICCTFFIIFGILGVQLFKV